MVFAVSEIGDKSLDHVYFRFNEYLRETIVRSRWNFYPIQFVAGPNTRFVEQNTCDAFLTGPGLNPLCGLKTGLVATSDVPAQIHGTFSLRILFKL
jgi:hypothetical protein